MWFFSGLLHSILISLRPFLFHSLSILQQFPRFSPKSWDFLPTIWLIFFYQLLLKSFISFSVHVHVYVHIYVCVHACVCMCVCVCVCTCACMCVHLNSRMVNLSWIRLQLNEILWIKLRDIFQILTHVGLQWVHTI